MKRPAVAAILIAVVLALSGCGVMVVQDEYSLDRIDGDIICEYRTGENAKWADECVDSDVTFDKDMFLKLFQEYNQYDTITGSKDPLKNYDLKINTEEQPEEWKTIFGSEFNVRAVFGDDYRDVSIYRYNGKLYFYVLSMGGRTMPEKKGQYFVELSEEMSSYWGNIIEEVEADSETAQRQEPAGTTAPSQNEPAEPASSLAEESAESEEIMFYAHIGENTLTIKPESNSSAEAFAELLRGGDITIDMHDYGSFEKVGPLGAELPTNDENITTEPGDVILYQGNQITIYYDTNTWNFTRLGKVQGLSPEEIRNVLGDGDPTVVFSLENDSE